MSTITSEIQGRSVEPSGKRAFISAAASTDTSVVRQVLGQQGIATFTADELDLPGLPFSEIVREGIEQADFVVGIVDNAAASENVLFELGFAQAMQKRTFVIVDTNTSSPFTSTFGIPYLRISPTNVDAVTYGLRQFVASKHKTLPLRSVAETHAIGSAADDLLTRLRAVHISKSAPELMKIIEHAIKLAGVLVVTEKPMDMGADLAVWSDDLVPWVTNPLMMQVKLSLPTKAAADRLFEQLSAALPSVRSTWALFVYMDAQPESLIAIDRGRILAISAERFVGSLRTTSFGELVRNLRNARVHGK